MIRIARLFYAWESIESQAIRRIDDLDAKTGHAARAKAGQKDDYWI